jgi:hypothetical protein
MKQKQQYLVGSIVKVPFESSRHTYARLLKSPIVAFYDAATMQELSPDFIVRHRILFQLPVMRYAVTTGHWLVIGRIPLEPELQQSPILFRQDAMNPDRIFFHQDGHEWPASRAECVTLERAAVWEPAHVEERLSDYYAGRTNRWVEQLKVK